MPFFPHLFKKIVSEKIYELLLLLCILLAISARLKNINSPLLDAHNFRQTQTATIARTFYNEGIDLFHTRLDIFGLDKNQTLIMEFPFYEAIVALLAYIFGFSDKLGKIVSIFFAISSSIVLYDLVINVTKNKLIGLISTILFLFAPLNIYFQQTFMLESTVVALHIFSLFSWYQYAQKRSAIWFTISIILTILAFLQKSVYAPFLVLPIVAILYSQLEKKDFFHFKWLIGLIIPVIVFILWQRYVDVTNTANGNGYFTSYSEGQRLWNFGTLEDRFSVEIWRTHLFWVMDSITKLMILPFFIGLLYLITKIKQKNTIILLIWLGSMFLYYLTFFRIQSHVYYFMPVIPIISFIAAYGIVSSSKFLSSLLLKKINHRSALFYIITALFLITFIITGWKNSKPFFSLDQYMLYSIPILNSNLKDKGYVAFVYPEYDWNSVYTYYTKRRGVALGAKDLTEEKIASLDEEGYTYIVIHFLPSVLEINNSLVKLFKEYQNVYQDNNLSILKINKI